MGKLNIPRHIPTPDEAYNEMMGVKLQPSENGIVEIEVEKLIPYHMADGSLQPFKLYNQEDLDQLAEGIKNLGVLSPVIVRPHKEQIGNYEIIAGHNRTNASKLAGLSTVPCIIKNVDDDEANVIMLDTNLDQRKELSFGELAKAYKMKLDLENKQGQRSDLTSRHNVVKFTSAEKRKAQRYARLTYLTSFLLVLVEEKKLPFMAGVELSYISPDSQECLYAYIIEKNIKISVDQAEQLRDFETTTPFTYEVLDGIFNPSKLQMKKPKRERTSISIKFIDIEEFVDVEQEDLNGYIIRALAFYKNNGGDNSE